ncbi:hypothetical protein BS50DRAFT_574530 [Corynespora cassiicola Philippines]|uniref:Uncharacterized protein n=1 Tax=Corynespora cassiicola Philippines TaxID=1448308 RepID=A0A2T2NKV9_CORCC|nr:hypothetical protein BS50DRAFT_574530 [Corynespora cassiicola Philippines]
MRLPISALSLIGFAAILKPAVTLSLPPVLDSRATQPQCTLVLNVWEECRLTQLHRTYIDEKTGEEKTEYFPEEWLNVVDPKFYFWNQEQKQIPYSNDYVPDKYYNSGTWFNTTGLTQNFRFSADGNLALYFNYGGCWWDEATATQECGSCTRGAWSAEAFDCKAEARELSRYRHLNCPFLCG